MPGNRQEIRSVNPDGSYSVREIDSFTGRVLETGTGTVTLQPDGSTVDESIRSVYDGTGAVSAKKWVTEIANAEADGDSSERIVLLDKATGASEESTRTRHTDGDQSTFESSRKFFDPQSGTTSEEKFTGTSDRSEGGGYSEVTERYEDGRLTQRTSYHSDDPDVPAAGNSQETTVKYKEDGGTVVIDLKNEQGQVTKETREFDKDGQQIQSPLPDDVETWGVHPLHPELTGNTDDQAFGLDFQEQASRFTSPAAVRAQLQDPASPVNTVLRNHADSIAYAISGLYPNR
jgi:hypothetical protein